MAEEKVKLSFEADIAGFKKTVQQIPGITEKEVNKMTSNYAKGIKKIGTKTDTIAKGVKKLADALGFGDKAGKIENLAESVKLIGPAGLAGAAGLAAIGAEVALIYGAGKAIVAFAEWVSDATAETEKLARPLALIAGMEIISSASIKAAADYNANLATLSTTSSGFAQILVDEFAPAMSEASAVAAGLVIEYLEVAKTVQIMADDFAAAHPIVADFFEELAGTMLIGNTATSIAELANSSKDLIGAWSRLGDEGRAATKAIEDDAQALSDWEAAKKRNDAADDKLLEKTKQVNEEIGNKRVEAVEKSEKAMLAAHLAGMALVESADDKEFEDFKQRQKEYVIVVQKKEAAIAAAHFAVQDAIAAADDAEMAAFMERSVAFTAQSKMAGDELKERLMGGLDAASALTDAIGGLADAEQQRHENTIEGMRNERAAMIEKYKAAGTLYTTDAKAAIGAQTDKIRAEKKAAKQAYAASKAMAITGIAISSAQAAIAMLANPAIALIPPPGNVLTAAGIAAAAGASQIAAVLAAPAPKFHGGRAPDEQPATLTRDEAVMNPRAVARLGGPQAVNALNAGASPGGGGSSVWLAIGQRQAEQIVQDGIGSKSVSMRVSKPDPLGSGRYGGRK